MAGDGTLIIEGAKELEKKLMQLEPKIGRKVVKQALRVGAKIIKGAVVANAPVKKGILKRATRVRVAKKNRAGTFAVMVTTGSGKNLFEKDKFYGSFIHLGHRVGPRRLGSRRKKIQPDPYIKEAFDNTKGRAESATIAHLKRGIEAVAKT